MKLSDENYECFLADESQQIALAQRVAQHLQSSFVMLLKGNLGVGKTTFARGFVQASGFDGVVKSPTYTIIIVVNIGYFPFSYQRPGLPSIFGFYEIIIKPVSIIIF